MKPRFLRFVSVFLLITFVTEIISPSIAYALTGGPGQPEVQSFQPAGTSDMVDPFTGDFSYNIPIMDVGGYPINIGYSSSITMDQEASWVGLGWNLNVGAINRSVRGLPDDFKGDQVTKTLNVKPNNTYGVNFTPNLQLFGVQKPKGGSSGGTTGGSGGTTGGDGGSGGGTKPKLSVTLGLSWNTYNGYGFDLTAQPSVTAADATKGSLNVGLGLSASSEGGVGIAPNVSYTSKVEKDGKSEERSTSSIGAAFNSRAGLSSLTLSSSVLRPSDKFYALGGRVAHNGGAQISFATPTYTPSLGLPMNSFSTSFSATLGGEIFGLHVNGELGGYYSRQALADKNRSIPAYGYLYAEESEKHARGDVMLDFNREKDGSFTKSTPNLALANHTYDVYNVQGQGVGGNYRPFRGDIGTVYDPYTTTNGTSTQLPGVELGGGNAAHIGTNFTFVKSNSHSGRWSRDNDAKNFLAFKSSRPGSKFYETAYFKQAGEKSADSDPELFNALGEFEPVRVELGSKNPGSSKSFLVSNNNQKIALTDATSTRSSRGRRNQVIVQQTADEAMNHALDTRIASYPANDFPMTLKGYTPQTIMERKGDHRKGHHLSEILVIRPDGARYVYGLPIYNKVQKEVSFAVSATPDCSTGLVSYTAQEASTNNNSGIDNYFEEVKTPAYATGYLLTTIVSPDYQDLTSDGPTDDDNGTYTRFNYSRTATDYKWRVPFESGKANYSEGLKSNRYDDKGNYLYGEKELWYVHSVETKTHVAEFYTSNREDGYGVVGERGGRGSLTTQKLDSIVLYAKRDRLHEKGGADGYKAIPIKTAHFVYDYSLCPGIPNSSTGKGKLTLKEVYFTYQNSNKGKFSPYFFHYDGENPSYNLKGYDRWGNYKPNALGQACGIEDVTTGEFPYVQQNKNLSDLYSAAWSMTSIDLPSGGKIKIDFESDDYAYVQDRKAMQMVTIEGVGNSPSASPVTGRSLRENRFLFFRLQEPVEGTQTEASDYVRRKYLGDISAGFLYFRAFVDLDGKGNYDYVPGYTKIVSSGVATASLSGGRYTHGYVELKGVGVRPNDENGDANAISKASWQFARLQRPEIIFGDETAPGDASVINIFKAMVSAGRQILQVVEGLNNHLDDRGYGRKIVPHKSTLRLYNATGFKYGGGSRVKRIAMTDEWSTLSNNTDDISSEYGQEYTYTTEIVENGQVRRISSGVAAYEPILGGDENPFRQPVGFSISKLLAPSDKYYMEEPFGEMFFQGPQVGYSKVTIASLKHEKVKRHATGHVVNEFYTSKDFPTIIKQTSLATNSYKPNFLLKILKVDVKEFMTASQGYVIELNDMHGKQKAQWVYAEDKGEPISGVEYFYKKTSPESNRLDNQVLVANKYSDNSGKHIFDQNVGVDYDVIADMREQESSSETSGIGGNLDTFFAALFPAAIPVVLPKMSREKVRFRSVVVTKVIQRYGLIEKVRAHDLGSTIETSNLLYDAETGEVLLTRTQNQFDDPVYSFNYPAHWTYNGMGMSYTNVGLQGDADDASLYPYLNTGDELWINGGKAWVDYASPYWIDLVDRQGNSVEAVGEFKVVRSGRRNQQTTSVGSIVCLQNPLQDVNADQKFDKLNFENVKVLNASAVEFSDYWEQPCECKEKELSGTPEPGVVIGGNRFIRGMAGVYRLSRSYTYLTDRIHTRANDNPDIRNDGTFQKFNVFWTAPPPNFVYNWYKSTGNWTFTSQVSIYNTSGSELENVDALNRYSSALYGYTQTLPKAVGNNVKLKEMGFDGFEDYDLRTCSDEHFSFYENAHNVSEQKAHSGKRSIRVPPNSSVELTKKFECPE